MKRSMKQSMGGAVLRTAVVTGIALGALAQGASAAVINGGFEAGSSGWDGTGDASWTDASFGVGPVSGARQGLITTHNESPVPEPGEPPEPDPLLGVPGQSIGPGGNAVGVSLLETFGGMSGGALNALATSLPGNVLNEGVTEGAAVRQTFTANAGDVLSFRFNLLSLEPSLIPFSDEADDFAYISLQGAESFLTLLADIFDTAMTPLSAPGLAGSFTHETGFMTFSQVLTVGGAYTLSVGVVDVGDNAIGSALLLDAVSLDAASVPEPAMLGVFGLGLAGLGVAARRRKTA